MFSFCLEFKFWVQPDFEAVYVINQWFGGKSFNYHSHFIGLSRRDVYKYSFNKKYLITETKFIEYLFIIIMLKHYSVLEWNLVFINILFIISEYYFYRKITNCKFKFNYTFLKKINFKLSFIFEWWIVTMRVIFLLFKTDVGWNKV